MAFADFKIENLNRPKKCPRAMSHVANEEELEYLLFFIFLETLKIRTACNMLYSSQDLIEYTLQFRFVPILVKSSTSHIEEA